MPIAKINGHDIAYETHGDPSNTPLVMIMGLGSQLVHWPDELIEALVARDLYIITPDNRDIGLSHKFADKGVPDIGQIMGDLAAGKAVEGPYSDKDMADDIAGLLDHLGISSAHIHGVSMGGMITQRFGVHHPEKARSLIVHMSTTGAPGLAPATPEAMGALLTPPPSPDRETVLEHSVPMRNAIGSPGFPSDPERIKEYTGRAYDRCYDRDGVARQLAAILTSGSRREAIQSITAPTLVIHGKDDPLVPVDGGEDVAANIKGARLEIIEGYGHDLPLQLVDRFTDLIAGFIEEVEAAQKAA